MIGICILLFWIGVELQMSTLYFIILAVIFFMKL